MHNFVQNILDEIIRRHITPDKENCPFQKQN